MAKKKLPMTIAIIPDGNRRWARAHKLSILKSYNNGVKKFVEFSEWCRAYGIRNVTVWAFSSENIKRSREEINALFYIYKKAATSKSLASRLHKTQTRIKIIGNKQMLPKDLIRSLSKLEKETEDYKEGIINVLIGYGGREDLIHSVKYLANHATLKIKDIEKEFEKHLISSQIPNIDFIIRTSGEKRLSGFMPWQTGYSELYFSKKLWPDFTRKDRSNALNDYNNRQRRFGR